MNKLSIGLKIGGGFLLVLIMFVIVSIVSFNNMEKQRESENMVDHTNRVMIVIESLKLHLSDAETGQRGFIITGMEHYLEPYNVSKVSITQTMTGLQNLTKIPFLLERIPKLNELITKKFAELQQTIDLRRNEGFDAANEVVKSDEGKIIMDQIRVILNDMEAKEEELLQQRLSIAKATTDQANRTILWLTIAAGIVVIGLVIYYTRIIAYPLRDLSSNANGIANGDLSVTIKETKRTDEMGILIMAIRTMTNRLQQQMAEINDGVNVLSSSASEIMTAVSQLSSTAAETVTSVSETTSTIEEVKQTAEVSNQKASDVAKSAQQTSDEALEGSKSIDETKAGMTKMKQQMESIASIVVRLSEQSQSIGEIASSVNDLAEQSNLLAVNASIEAAKAGEQGKGFSVVAQEIKNLADRSKESTSQIRSILTDIQKAISSAVMATEQGGKVADEGLQLSKTAANVIESLNRSVNEATQSSIQIASSSNQQLVGMDQITTAMEAIKEASIQTSASTKQTESSVEDIHKLGETLKDILSQYKLK